MQSYRRALAILAALFVFGLAFVYSTPTYAADFDCTTATDVSQAQCEALMDLYDATDGDNWLANTNWAVSTTVCSWSGIQCMPGTPPLNVIFIYLPANGLSGDISGVPFDDLTGLLSLDVSENALTGTLPTALPGSIGVLNLHMNQFSGTIPTSWNFTNFPAMQTLMLYDNTLTGAIPASITTFDNLMTLDASDNQLSGSLPSNIGDLNFLQVLRLNRNDLSGNLPASLGNMTTLTELMLSENAFTGALPANMSTWTALQTLYIGQNNFSGAVPNLTSSGGLSWLDLYQASDTCVGGNENGLNGEIGTWLTGANFPNLSTLNLSDNCFTGDLPNMTGAPVAFVNLSRNPWTAGAIPAWVSSSITLENILMDYAQRTGTIPTMASSALQQFAVGGNALTGNIPTSFNSTNHPNMTALSVYANNLGGDLPTQIGTLTGLTYLSLQGNNFTSLPASLTNLTELEDFNGLWLNYNVLEPTEMSSELIAFVDSVYSPADPAWQNTQTLAPGNVQVTNATTSSVTLSWTHRGDFTYPGHYEVGVSTTDGGTYTFDAVNHTANKNVSSLTISNLDAGTDLAAETTYYFVVRKVRDFLPAFAPQSISGNSAQISAVTTDGGGDPTDPPSKPQLVSPTAGEIVIGDASPAFTWETNAAEEAVTSYRLFVRDAKNVVLANAPFNAAEVCAGGVCTGDLSELDTPVNLKNGEYSFRVRATNSEGNADSNYRAFSIAFPAKPVLVSPINNIALNDAQPEFTWTETEGAAEYRLTIYNAAKKKVGGTIWLASAEANCDGTDCSFDLTPTSLKNGAYSWKVEARDTAVSPSKSQSVQGKFRVAFPGAPTNLIPAPATTLDIASPTFTWTPVANATKYRITITRNVKPTPPALNQVFNAVDICTLDTCTVDLATLGTPVALKKGAHKWQVKATAPGGYTSATAKQGFTIVLP